MAMDATMQIRMDSELKSDVETLYRNMGTSFAEAVRIFARQSLLVGGMPFRPALKTWEELTPDEIGERLAESDRDITLGKIRTQEQLDRIMKERFSDDRTPPV